MKQSNAIHLTKRGGTIENFEFGKLRRCVAKGMDQCGYDGRYADALADAVEMHLRKSRGKRRSTNYVFECVLSVLHETGLKDVAKVLNQHRREREARRKVLTVIDGGSGGVPARWCKDVVADTFSRQYGLSQGMARFLGGLVEDQVLGHEAEQITASSIAEFMHAELVGWGLAPDALKVGEMREAGNESDTVVSE
ncbi:MAG: ATP cone domain-containing protein [Phycisphaerae bacterium]